MANLYVLVTWLQEKVTRGQFCTPVPAVSSAHTFQTPPVGEVSSCGPVVQSWRPPLPSALGGRHTTLLVWAGGQSAAVTLGPDPILFLTRFSAISDVFEHPLFSGSHFTWMAGVERHLCGTCRPEYKVAMA